MEPKGSRFRLAGVLGAASLAAVCLLTPGCGSSSGGSSHSSSASSASSASTVLRKKADKAHLTKAERKALEKLMKQEESERRIAAQQSVWGKFKTKTKNFWEEIK